MKTAPLPRYFRHSQAGYTLLEAIVALTITTMLVAAVLGVSRTFFGSRLFVQCFTLNQRLQIELLGREYSKAVDGGNAFVFAGRLLNADDSPYVGASLSLDRPGYKIDSASTFLAVSGLKESPPTVGEFFTVVTLTGGERPVLLTREALPLVDGSTQITVQMIGLTAGPGRRIRFLAPPGTAVDRLSILRGRTTTDVNGGNTVIFPNPLALPASLLPSLVDGLTINLPQRHIRVRQ